MSSRALIGVIGWMKLLLTDKGKTGRNRVITSIKFCFDYVKCKIWFSFPVITPSRP